VTTTQTAYAFRRRGELPVLTWPAFDGLPADVVVTTRDGGVSTGTYASLNLGLHVGDDEAAVLRNRRLVAAAVGAEPDDLVFCEQAHRRVVAVVGAADRGRGSRSRGTAVQGTDALVTTTPGVALVVMVADCVPLVLLDPVAGVLACVHAGWGGTVREVTPAAVDTMVGLGADPARIVAGVGPAISPERYQVGDEVAVAAREAGLTDEVIRPDGTGRWLFDLWAANCQQLRAAGVQDANIHVAAVPTGEDGPFFSHRTEQPCGRFAAVARLHDTTGPAGTTGSTGGRRGGTA
jgi:polyphenol oxidase